MRLPKNLLFFCALVGLVLLPVQPAFAQSSPTCITDSSTLSVRSEFILDCIRAGHPINFDGITINGDLDLTSLYTGSEQEIIIPSEFVISNSHFTGSLISYNGNDESVLIFQAPVDLRGSEFVGNVDFTGTTFEEFAHFENTRFHSEANFTDAKFRNGAFFYNSLFNRSTSFMNANISGGIDFSEAQFFEQANFSMLHSIQNPDPLLHADISFSGAHFTGNVYFMEAVFENQVLFNDAVFHRISPEDAILFTNSTFSTLDLSNASFENAQLDLSGQLYQDFIMPNFHPSILATQNSMEGLSALKDNFYRQGNINIVNEISYWQNGVQRREKPFLVQILETVFLDWTFGYGLKPFHSLIASGILILFFAIFYYPPGILRPTIFAPSKPRERKFTIRLTEIPIAPDEEIITDNEKKHRGRSLPPQFTQAWQAIVFSLGVFTKLSSGKFVAVRLGFLVVAEWIIGLIVIAGMLFSLANTNPLLRSILDLLR
jgi:uncharacterized protein YjbI with pentapeptide repeats